MLLYSLQNGSSWMSVFGVVRAYDNLIHRLRAVMDIELLHGWQLRSVDKGHTAAVPGGDATRGCTSRRCILESM